MYFQENDVPINNVTQLSSLAVPGDGQTVSYFQVRSSQPWTIESATEVVLSQNSGPAGVTNDISVYVSSVNDSNNVQDWTITLKNKGTGTIPDDTLTINQQSYSGGVLGIPTDVRFEETSDDVTNVGVSADLDVTASDNPDTFHIALANSSQLGVDFWSDANATGNFSYTPTVEGLHRFAAYASNEFGDSADDALFNLLVTQQDPVGSDDPFFGVTTNPPTFTCEGGSHFQTGITPKNFDIQLLNGSGKFCLGGLSNCKSSLSVTSGNFTVYATPHYTTNLQNAESQLILTADGYIPKYVYLQQSACSPVNPSEENGGVIEETGGGNFPGTGGDGGGTTPPNVKPEKPNNSEEQ